MLPLPRSFYLQDTRRAARELLGCRLVLPGKEGPLAGRVVETEAYLPGDPASHAFRGPSPRNQSMFLSGGHAYVYLIYGVHYCFNVVCQEAGTGAAVLIRALEPLGDWEQLWKQRFPSKPLPPLPSAENPCPPAWYPLTSGPGKLCGAYGIHRKKYDGLSLDRPSFFLSRDEEVPSRRVGQSRRIGLGPGKGQEKEWRWFLKDSPWISKNPPGKAVNKKALSADTKNPNAS